MLDVVNRRWSQPILKISQLDEQLLPKVYESPEITGGLPKRALPAVHECTPLCTLPHTGCRRVSCRYEQHERMRTTDEARSLLAS